MMDDLPTYEVHQTEVAEADIEGIYLWRLQISPSTADKWSVELRKAVESLEQLPRRCPIAPESRLYGSEVRQLLFGRGSNVYRILFRIFEKTEEVPARVLILRIRHASMQPIEEGE